MFRYTVKKFITVTVAALIACLFAFGVRVANLSRFSAIEGDRTFFLDSASSQGLRVQTLSFADIGRVKGECVHLDLNAYEGGRYATNDFAAEAFVQDITEKYGAEIVKTEEVCGVVSYYCYTNRWGDPLYIEGRAVNLHIAVNGTACAVGSPIIFDGF